MNKAHAHRPTCDYCQHEWATHVGRVPRELLQGATVDPVGLMCPEHVALLLPDTVKRYAPTFTAPI